MFEPDAKVAGFYVDVGAHHPIRFSNTYLFYRRGWRGVNFDAMPGSMRAFDRLRPRDANLEVGVAEQDCTLVYHSFSEPALNTFSEELAATYAKEPHVKLVGTSKIVCRPLAQLLVDSVPPGTTIDFLSVDVEGLDLPVLRSNDWERFRPRVLLVESLDTPLVALANSPTAVFLRAQDYSPVAKTVSTVFFRDTRSQP
jgi:hypothetical protein